AAVALVIAVAAGVAWSRWKTYLTEPPQIAEHVVVRRGVLFSSAPSISREGLIYESMEGEFIALRSGQRLFSFGGEAFHPSGSPVHFELVRGGQSQITRLDERTVTATGIEPALSADGRRLAYISGDALMLDSELLISGYASDPAFFSDGERIVFAQGYPGKR